ncbi:MAG: tetratricopeptide repeat protein [Bacteroidales bacterium]
MKRYLFIVFVSIFLLNGIYAQVNLRDSFQLSIRSTNIDTVKIDKINKLIFLYASNQPDIALTYSDSAVFLAEKLSDSSRIAQSLTRKGVSLFYLGDYNQSLEYYFKAVRVKQNSGDTSELWREYNNIGLVLRNLDQNNEALDFFNKALRILQNSSNKSFEAILLDNIGLSLRGIKEYNKAIETLEKALAINVKNGEKKYEAQDLNNLGNVYKDLKEYTKAADYYRRALAINNEIYNNYDKIHNLNNLGDISILLKDYKNAEQFLDSARQILNLVKADQLKLNNLNMLAIYNSEIGNYRKAYFYRSRYSTMRDSLYKLNRLKQFDQLKTLANAENEIQKLNLLKRINNIQKEKISQQKLFQAVTGIIILALLALLYFLFKSLKQKKKLNQSLKIQTDELGSLNEELKITNEELTFQRSEIEAMLNQLKSTQDQLIHAEKMASLGLLSAGVAHEINNPLNFIQGGVTALELYLNDDLKQHKEKLIPLIDVIKTGIDRAASIVLSLNRYSRQDKMKRENCDIHLVINNCLKILQNQIKNRIRIVKDYCSNGYSLVANEGQIHQVMLNILANSAQSIENEGEISISTQTDDKNLKITVKDTGSGISEENLARIFDPFFTTKEPGKGTGLGLSITYKIIESHGGTIEIESKLGKGTKAIIKFPLASGTNELSDEQQN